MNASFLPKIEIIRSLIIERIDSSFDDLVNGIRNVDENDISGSISIMNRFREDMDSCKISLMIVMEEADKTINELEKLNEQIAPIN